MSETHFVCSRLRRLFLGLKPWATTLSSSTPTTQPSPPPTQPWTKAWSMGQPTPLAQSHPRHSARCLMPWPWLLSYLSSLWRVLSRGSGTGESHLATNRMGWCIVIGQSKTEVVSNGPKMVAIGTIQRSFRAHPVCYTLYTNQMLHGNWLVRTFLSYVCASN